MTVIVAEVGINHNGSLDQAKQLIDAAAAAGADYVKFQKRDPSMQCEAHRDLSRIRETPWGTMSHIEYRRRLEFNKAEYRALDTHCKERGINWFFSIWDEPSLSFAMEFDHDFIKIPSALLTDKQLVAKAAHCGRHLILSTGMSTLDEIRTAVNIAETDLWLLHCHSSYPAPTEELNLTVIPALAMEFPHCRIGYSGHEYELEPSIVAVVLGASMIERHITLDRTMWGSDQMASVEPRGFAQLVARIKNIERALGDGKKRVWESERVALEKLRPPELRV